MNNFKVTIGIEIHLELLTKTKMFSSSPNTFGKEYNTQINEVDLGYPGSMPVVNKQAVIFVIKLAKALNMEIDNELSFDRKHYYYPDLSKGYQITQQTRPIGKNGTLPIMGIDKVVEIERIHLEEDTAKQIHKNDGIYLDFNRAGIPLIEIVTLPTIHSAEEAIAYVKTIQAVARELGISDAKMENGSLRTDINISLSSNNKLGTKVEIKNMNSFANIKKSIENEINEQTNNLIKNQEIKMTTKKFDELTQTNIVMREKTDNVDYKFLKEPNIIPIKLSKNFIDSIVISVLPWERRKAYVKDGLNSKMIEQLMTRSDLSKFYNDNKYKNRLLLAKTIFGILLPIVNKKNIKLDKLDLSHDKLNDALLLLEKNEITNTHMKTLISLLISTNKNVKQIVEENKMFIISSKDEIESIVKGIIKNEKVLVNKMKDNSMKLKNILLGKLMKKTNGQVNMKIATSIIQKILTK